MHKNTGLSFPLVVVDLSCNHKQLNPLSVLVLYFPSFLLPLYCSLCPNLSSFFWGWVLSWKGNLAGQFSEFGGLDASSNSDSFGCPLHPPTNGMGVPHFLGRIWCLCVWWCSHTQVCLIPLSSLPCLPHFPQLPSARLLASCRPWGGS